MSIAGIYALVRTIWAWRFPIAILLGIAAAGGIWLRIQWLESRVEHFKAERSELIATNQATMEALDQVKAEKARNEALLKDRAARKSKEADQLSAIIKRLGTYDATKDCPVSPAINDVLNGGM